MYPASGPFRMDGREGEARRRCGLLFGSGMPRCECMRLRSAKVVGANLDWMASRAEPMENERSSLRRR